MLKPRLIEGGSLAHVFARAAVPMAFAMFAIVFALQVAGQSELFGGIPYVLLGISAVLTTTGRSPRADRRRSSVAPYLDAAVVAMTGFVALHALAGILLGVIDVAEGARVSLIYGASSWVYWLICIYADDSELDGIINSIAMSSMFLAAHWCVDTFAKMVLHKISLFQYHVFDYVLERNKYNNNQVNVSLLGIEYRAYGLQDKHTTTGALVGIGGLSSLCFFWNRSFVWRLWSSLAFVVVATIGMATLAWISVVLLLPFGLILSERKEARGQAAVKALITSVIFAAALLLGLQASDKASRLLDIVWNLFATQASFVANIDGSLAQTSWVRIYTNELAAYLVYIANNPLSALVGEGFSGYGQATFPRGGDAAIFEFAATFGIPLSVAVIAAVLLSAWTAIRTAASGNCSPREAALLAFAGCTLLFLLMSLAHYNTWFNKSIYVYMFLALGIVGRLLPTSGKSLATPAPVG